MAVVPLIPARGGSERVPRKNLREVRGFPLLVHAIALSVGSGLGRPWITTEDPVIASLARIHGAHVIERPRHLAEAHTTIAQVVQHACDFLPDGDVAVIQPTSPGLRASTVAEMVHTFETTPELGSMATAVRERHLMWYERAPLYVDRVNSQQATHELHRETGGLHLVRRGAAADGTMVTPTHRLFEVPEIEGLDIDTPDDLRTARRLQRRHEIMFVVTAGTQTGTGHLHRALTIADELCGHNISFIMQRETTGWAQTQIVNRGYPMRVPTGTAPDLIISDCLAVEPSSVLHWRAYGASVAIFEDVGPGAALADMVVNELYDPVFGDGVLELSGPTFAVLRSEFSGLPEKSYHITGRPARVLVSFGGTDPRDLTRVVVDTLAEDLQGLAVEIRATVPRGTHEPFPQYPSVRWLENPNMLEELYLADVAVTSRGRTVHEAAACGTPVLPIAVNQREMEHAHVPGAIEMGYYLHGPKIGLAVLQLLVHEPLRAEHGEILRGAVDGHGTRRVVSCIESLLDARTLGGVFV